MKRFLFCPWPAAGDTLPLVIVAANLQARGHRVAFFGSAAVARWTELAGLPLFLASDDCYAKGFGGANRGNWAEAVPCFVEELETICADFHPDVLVDAMLPPGARLVAERRGTPQASICTVGCPFFSADLFPFGSGMPPAENDLQRSLLRVVRQELEPSVASEIEQWNRIRAGMGLPPAREHPWYENPSRSLILIPTTEAFEYPRPDLPAHAYFVGPLLWDLQADSSVPVARDSNTPLIYVSQGFTFTRTFPLIRLVFEALGDAPVQIVVSVGRDWKPGELGEIPRNALVTRELRPSSLLPNVDLAIVHGGFGTVQTVLLHGVPLIVAPFAADQPENAERVERAGAGLHLNTNQRTPEILRAAVQRILTEPGFRANAQRLQSSLASHAGPSEAADLLECLARMRRPVLRNTLLNWRETTWNEPLKQHFA